MNTDQLVPYLLGPLGLTVGLMTLVWMLVTEKVVPRGRLDDQKAATREALDIARQANESTDRMSNAIEARNQLDAERLRSQGAFLRQGGTST